MKKLILTFLMVFLLVPLTFAQSDSQGIKYQAVARDLSGKLLANQKIFLQIKLKDNFESNAIYYSELHEIATNEFGLFSLIVGGGQILHGEFNKIPWSSNEIWMEIAIKDSSISNFNTISNSKLLAVPYAFHAITADKLTSMDHNEGILNKVDSGLPSANWKRVGNSKTDSEKDKIGTTDYEDLVMATDNIERLRIAADGNIKIDRSLDIGQDLNVGRNVFLNYKSNIQIDDYILPRGQTFNNGNFTVLNESSTYLTGTLAVDSTTNINGQTTIKWLKPGLDSDYNSYPLKVFGSNTGIAIKVDDDEPGPENNWITFFNNQDVAIARIEGNANVISDAILIIEAILRDEDSVLLSNGENYNLNNDNDKNFLKEKYFKNDTALDFGKSYAAALWHAFMTGVKLGIAIPTVGVEADFDDTIDHLKECLKNLVAAEKIILTGDQLGATYSSGGADYAEWLIKENPNEQISFGEVVGVKGGVISKTFTDANQFMAITSNPIIVGGMPKKGLENNFEKVALMGQVPIIVFGKANVGDYILPSGNGDGNAKAVSPKLMKADDFSKIIGVAWSASNDKNSFNYINTAVGFNTNQMGMIINNMQSVMNVMQLELMKLNPAYKPIYFVTNKNSSIDSQADSKVNLKEDIIENPLALETCYEACKGEDWGLDTFKCYMKCFIQNGDVSSISAENNIVIDLLEKLKNETVKPKVENITVAINEIFPDVSALDKIPEIKNIVLDIMDGPPYTKPSNLGTIVNKLKNRIVRINRFID